MFILERGRQSAPRLLNKKNSRQLQGKEGNLLFWVFIFLVQSHPNGFLKTSQIITNDASERPPREAVLWFDFRDI